MVFTNIEHIREKFIKDGWNENTSFEELSLKEAEEKGFLSIRKEICFYWKWFCRWKIKNRKIFFRK